MDIPEDHLRSLKAGRILHCVFKTVWPYG